MTLEELKAEARKHGYNLIPRNEKEPLLPCICGCKRREHWYGQGDRAIILRCRVCELEAVGRTEREAYRNWNAMIRRLTNDEKGN